jgi:formate--tetrahydrofolate ligase
MTDIEIAQQTTMERIVPLAERTLGISGEHLEPYGHYKAKIHLDYLASLGDRSDGKLVLVTAISPTPAGEGKTTTSVGLTDALNRLGKKAIVCLREPSLGPCFGVKGGAAGGGHAQVVPMEDINLHFTGDFHAIGLANNLLAALIDNHIHHGNPLELDQRRITWKRGIDMNDRALRQTTVGLGGVGNGFPRTDGFDITVASEVMAIFCLATSLQELKERLGNIVVGESRQGRPVTARDLKADGAMTVLLKDAFQPNLVQTLEGNPAIIHGGPFANIAHGCNSVIATKAALKLGEIVVTEAGFGADLGAEKFIDIKCRKSGLRPDASVIVATLRALKFHGGARKDDLSSENPEALVRGLANLERHIRNVREQFGLPCVVAINRFPQDTDKELELLMTKLSHHQIDVCVADHWARGGAGAEDLARAVLQVLENRRSNLNFCYPDDLPLWKKIEAVAIRIYHAREVVADTAVRAQIRRFQDCGYGHYPVCIAKTPFSFSTDPKLLGAPSGHVLKVREVRLAAGAEFLIAICGNVMTMPGLPREPAANRIDLDENGRIIGLF